MSGREGSEKSERLTKETLIRTDSVLGDFPKKKVLVKRKGMSRRDFVKIFAGTAALVGLALAVPIKICLIRPKSPV